MKFILSLSLLGIFSLSALSQSNQDLENAHWVNSRTESSSGGWSWWLAYAYGVSTSKDDTIINSKSYLKVIGEHSNPNAYVGALRVDSTRWYFCAADSSQEMLLYDFGLNPGDVLTEKIYVDERYYADTLICTHVSFTNINGVNRKLIDFQAGGGTLALLAGNHLMNGSWIDGIGNPQGMLEEFFSNISQYSLRLACFSINDTVYYTGGPYNSQQSTGCDATFSVDEKLLYEDFEIFPNPSAGVFTLKFPNFHEALRVSVYSLDGRKLFDTEANQPELKLELNLPEGIYLLRYVGKLERGNESLYIVK